MHSANGILYGIKDDGTAVWYRHDGRSNGAFRWQGPLDVANDWDEVSSILGGDDGIVYTVGEATQPDIQIDKQAPAPTGGDLLWRRHIGRADGTSEWEGPKKVGDNWGRFHPVFSAGGGVIYAVQPGGNLLWYRHTGRDDGSFEWEGPNVVGTGWGAFAHVFCGGDGVIYAVKPMVQPLVQIDKRTPRASGGQLLWYRHIGQADGTNRWEGPKTVGTGWNGLLAPACGGAEPLAEATGAIGDYWRENLSILTVGSPTGPPVRDNDGGYLQGFTFGGILKPMGVDPLIVTRYHVSVEIAAIYCYATDDPGGTDEPYLIATTYGIDPGVGETSVQSVVISNNDLGDHEDGDVFGQSRQLANNFTILGDGDIRVHISLWDEELGINPEKATGLLSDAVRDAITAGLPALGAAIGSVLPGVGTAAGLAAGAGLSWLMAQSGITEAVGEAVGGAVVDIFGDDLVDQHDFVIPSSFLQTLCTGDASTLDRTSQTINGTSYNFPQGPEDDSWLFDRGPGKGTYRIFLRVSKV